MKADNNVQMSVHRLVLLSFRGNKWFDAEAILFHARLAARRITDRPLRVFATKLFAQSVPRRPTRGIRTVDRLGVTSLKRRSFDVLAGIHVRPARIQFQEFCQSLFRQIGAMHME